MEYLSLIPAIALGYLAFKAISHPTSRIRRKMPNVVIKKRVHLFPAFRIYIFGRVFHLHHWITLSILLVLSLFTTGGVLAYMVTKGILIGGILQGLRLPKGHRKMVYRDFSLEKLTSASDRK